MTSSDARASRKPAQPPAQPRAPAGPEERCACLEARMTARALTRMYDAALRPARLKATQYSLLAALERGAAGSISALAEALALERTSLTRNLRLLETAGLIAPRPGGGRAVGYALTEAGRAALAQATPLWRKAQARVLAALGETGQAQAYAGLRALREAARATPGTADRGEG
ncbi:MarR family winged helix-turn-helix transcriptional regulator [Camelimonas abortus]|uniref:MarR family winged helix-turn-helix transcriptional regulator n=1 Tax=Camelimonas abortus TaxID=1017184 RepID=A0ABV7LGF5_9HYPH